MYNPEPPQTNPILEDGEYVIALSQSVKALEYQNRRTRQLVQSDLSDSAKQIFILKRQACGNYTVQRKSNGLFLYDSNRSGSHYMTYKSVAERTNLFNFTPRGANGGYFKYNIVPSNEANARLRVTTRGNVVFDRTNDANSNYLFYCLRIVTNDTYPVAPPLVGMETVLNIIPSLQILESRAAIPENSFECNQTNICWSGIITKQISVCQPDKSDCNWIDALQIGDIVDARDDEGKWYESVIRWIEVRYNRKILCIHYIGWDKKWDETIYADNLHRIAKRNTKTSGPHRARPVPCRQCRKVHPPKYRYPLSYSNNWIPE